MKSLKESLLMDQEDALSDFDNLEKDLRAEMKELQHIVSRVKYWERTIKKIHYIRLGIPNLLKLMGYDADTIEIVVRYEGVMRANWRIDIVIVNNSRGDREFLYDSIIYISELATKCFKDVLKNVLVPACKNINSFKKFLEKVKARKNTLNPINNLDDIL